MSNLKVDSILYRKCFERILDKTQGLIFAYTYLHLAAYKPNSVLFVCVLFLKINFECLYQDSFGCISRKLKPNWLKKNIFVGITEL